MSVLVELLGEVTKPDFCFFKLKIAIWPILGFLWCGKSWDFYLFSNVVTVGECPVVAPRQCYPLLHHADSSTSLVIQIDLSDSFTLRMRFIEVFACTLDRPKYKVTLSLMNREVTLYIIHLCGAFRHLSLHKCAINSRNFFAIFSYSTSQQNDKRAFFLDALPHALEFANLALCLRYILHECPLCFECILRYFLRVLPNYMLESLNEVLLHFQVKQR